MRERSLSLVATIATSVTIACSDAAVEKSHGTNTCGDAGFPGRESASQLRTKSGDADGLPARSAYRSRFHRASRPDTRHLSSGRTSPVSGSKRSVRRINGWLINKNGATINEGSAGFTPTRFGIPVARETRRSPCASRRTTYLRPDRKEQVQGATRAPRQSA